MTQAGRKWSPQVDVVALFEELVHFWGRHLPVLSAVELGMMSVHLQSISTLTDCLAREASRLCGGKYLLPCPAYEDNWEVESPEAFSRQLVSQLQSLAADRAARNPAGATLSRRRPSVIDIPAGVETFSISAGDEEDSDGRSSSSAAAPRTPTQRTKRRSQLHAPRSKSPACIELSQEKEAQIKLKQSEDRVKDLEATLARKEEACEMLERELSKERHSSSRLHRDVSQYLVSHRSLSASILLPNQAEEEQKSADGPSSHPAAAASPTQQNILTVVRVKPMQAHAAARGNPWELHPQAITDTRSGAVVHFDQVFGPKAETEHLFDSARHLVKSFCDGINVTIMAYGQTASGKTHTMFGSEQHGKPGVVSLAVEEIFSILKNRGSQRSRFEFKMRATSMEIYNEDVCDSLSKDRTKVQLHKTLQGTIRTVPQLTSWTVTDAKDVKECVDQGTCHRHVGKTMANERSSRSHFIIQLHLEWQEQGSGLWHYSVLNFVDLAGSESSAQTGSSAGSRLQRESSNINCSLLSLSKVVSAAADAEAGQHSSRASTPRIAPVRESKLTRVLEQSIGGNARTLLICTISADDDHHLESRRTLDFAKNARSIKNKAYTNVRADAPRNQHQQEELQRLRAENQQLKAHMDDVQEKMIQLRAPLESTCADWLLSGEVECTSSANDAPANSTRSPSASERSTSPPSCASTATKVSVAQTATKASVGANATKVSVAPRREPFADITNF
eukprot:CAMPEP_0178408626 /NCGR_PEP_ID=MMETSP0689_2-20121128/20040_1 /TAXON_ID=160604 /ORGANISM="Amphidinium massartii, Strain CS-259" /LENGTH=733 /DNA_ID=CAMNT_0020029735 /DNA_START=37 /DNA_END=2235 /DNA_ORIENTATION=+